MTRSFSWCLALRPAHTEKFRKPLKSMREVDTSEPLSGEMVTFVQHTCCICQKSSHDRGFGNLHVLSYSGFLRQLASYLTHCEHRALQRQRWGIIPPNQAVSVQRRDVLERLFGVLVKWNTENDCSLKR